MARKSLDKWIDEAMCDAEKARITRFTLVHAQGTQFIEIHSHKIPEKGGVDPKYLANMFRGKAEAYSQDLPGVQTFVLWAYYGTNEPEARQPFMVNVQPDHTAGGMFTEPPTEQGMTMQRMRQGEAMFQQVYRRQQVMDEFALRMIDTQGRMIDRLLAENMDNQRLVMEVIAQQKLNDHTQRMKEYEYQRSTSERKKWFAFAPVLVNTLLGKEVFPQSTEDTALIEGLAEGLDDAMLSKLMQVGLPDEMLGPIAARINKALDRKREEESRRKALPVYKGKSDDDVTGGSLQ